MVNRELIKKLVQQKKNENQAIQRRISVAQMCNEMNVKLSTFNTPLNESRNVDPNLSTLEKIANYFNVSIDELAGRSSSGIEPIEIWEKEKLYQIIYDQQLKITKLLEQNKKYDNSQTSE